MTAADLMRTPLASSGRSWLVQTMNRRWMGDTSRRRRTTGVAKGSRVVGGLSHRRRPPHQAGWVGGCGVARRAGRSRTVAPASATTRFHTKTCANHRRRESQSRRWRRCRRQSRPPPTWTNDCI
jgi:hypothetical protein